ncbi:DUF948 domain-containing protein [Salinithrix halophila]|uniref:DUF948 domain-containing protein n=1 Tax=Salinithrix halophila TaxID=1485204 RepID=A0ABV8JDL4_9BACL
MVIQISAAVAATAFVTLVVALVRSLNKVNHTLDSVDRTLEEMKPQVEEVINRTKSTLDETNRLLADLQAKSQKTNALFQTVDSVGHGLQELSSTLTKTAVIQKERLSNVSALVSSGLDMFRKWRSDKRSNKKSVTRVK